MCCASFANVRVGQWLTARKSIRYEHSATFFKYFKTFTLGTRFPGFAEGFFVSFSVSFIVFFKRFYLILSYFT